MAQPIDYSQVFLHVCPVVKIPNINHGREITLSVEINGYVKHIRTPDCQVGHFGHNFYVRTRKGMRGEKYKTLGGLKAAVEAAIKMRLRVEVLRWVDRQN